MTRGYGFRPDGRACKSSASRTTAASPRRATGASAAGSGEIVVLLNNDVDCRPDFLERLVAPLAQVPVSAAVAALMLQPGGARSTASGSPRTRRSRGSPGFRGCPSERAGAPQPVLAGPAGTAAAYRRRRGTRSGGSTRAIFAYMEDFDLGLRLRGAGWKAACAPDAVGVHLGSATHGHRSPGSDATAASAAATCCAATACCAAGALCERWPPRPSSSSEIWLSRATWPRSGGACRAGVRLAGTATLAPTGRGYRPRHRLSRFACAAPGGLWTPRRLSPTRDRGCSSSAPIRLARRWRAGQSATGSRARAQRRCTGHGGSRGHRAQR